MKLKEGIYFSIIMDHLLVTPLGPGSLATKYKDNRVSLMNIRSLWSPPNTDIPFSIL